MTSEMLVPVDEGYGVRPHKFIATEKEPGVFQVEDHPGREVGDGRFLADGGHWFTFRVRTDEDKVLNEQEALDRVVDLVLGTARDKKAKVEEGRRLDSQRAKDRQEEIDRLLNDPNTPRATAYRCPQCEATFPEEPEDDPRYECGGCGHEFSYSETDSHRCEICGKFASKAYETTCPDCENGIDGYDTVLAILLGTGEAVFVEETA